MFFWWVDWVCEVFGKTQSPPPYIRYFWVWILYSFLSSLFAETEFLMKISYIYSLQKLSLIDRNISNKILEFKQKWIKNEYTYTPQVPVEFLASREVLTANETDVAVDIIHFTNTETGALSYEKHSSSKFAYTRYV